MAVSTFSHSGLDSFRTCPRRYKFEVIDRVDVPTVSAAKQLGTAVHKQLQVLYQRKSDGKEYPLDEMLAAYDKDWSTSNPEDLVVVVEHMTIDDYIERGRKMLTDYYEANHPFEHGRILGVERHRRFFVQWYTQRGHSLSVGQHCLGHARVGLWGRRAARPGH